MSLFRYHRSLLQNNMLAVSQCLLCSGTVLGCKQILHDLLLQNVCREYMIRAKTFIRAEASSSKALGFIHQDGASGLVA